jgi:Rieske Fe-S protein
MANKICSHCGCKLRKAKPTIIIINLEVICIDDLENNGVWVCPYCQYPNV